MIGFVGRRKKAILAADMILCLASSEQFLIMARAEQSRQNAAIIQMMRQK
jgi:hypothetical protein